MGLTDLNAKLDLLNSKFRRPTELKASRPIEQQPPILGSMGLVDSIPRLLHPFPTKVL